MMQVRANEQSMKNEGIIEKKFCCEYCGMNFAFLSLLKQHYVVHTKEAKYTCDLCGRVYTRMGQLTIHSRTHTGEQPYKCNICSEKFGSTYQLRRHMSKHSTSPEFTCEFCGKEFSYKQDWRNHIRRKHTEKRIYKCVPCNTTFTYVSSLKRHLFTFHGDLVEVNFAPVNIVSRIVTASHLKWQQVVVILGQDGERCRFEITNDLDISKEAVNQHLQFEKPSKNKNHERKSYQFVHRTEVKEVRNNYKKARRVIDKPHATTVPLEYSLDSTVPSSTLVLTAKVSSEGKQQQRDNEETVAICLDEDGKLIEARETYQVVVQNHSIVECQTEGFVSYNEHQTACETVGDQHEAKSQIDKFFRCEFCEEIFFDYMFYINHMIAEEGTKLHTCNECSILCTSIDGYKKHRRESHSEVSLTEIVPIHPGQGKKESFKCYNNEHTLPLANKCTIDNKEGAVVVESTTYHDIEYEQLDIIECNESEIILTDSTESDEQI